jgi:hypothetical protein
MGLNKLMPLTVLPATTRGVVSQPSATHRNFLRPASGKCLHYYFYFMDDEFGVVCLRVPTWCPFRLQFYCNGHSWLACQLTRRSHLGLVHVISAMELCDSFSPSVRVITTS